MHLEDLINRNYSNLNENDYYIWDYIRAHRKESESIAIEDLATKCHVSRSTILRFTKRLGLNGYAEFKVYLRMDNESQREKQDGVELVYHTYEKFMQEIKDRDFQHVIELITNAKNAYVYGTGSIQNNVAAEIKRSFLIVDKLFFNISTANESYVFADIITQEDVIIMISYSGENPQLLDFAKKLKAKNVSIISITVARNNSLSHMAEESLFVDVPDIENPLGPRHEGLVSYFLLLDFILVKYIDYHERRMKL